MLLSPEARAAHLARRARLATLLAGRPALLASGAPSPRVYAANTFPFRAGSHFLYLCGVSAPSSWLLLEGERATLFTVASTPDDALWHGATPSLGAIAESTGLVVRDLAELEAAVRGLPLATLPAIDWQTCLAQSALLGREVRPGALAHIDEPLADAMIALRLVQDDYGASEMRKAVATTARAHGLTMRASRPGVRESELRAVMEGEMLRDDCAPAYGTILTVHGEVLHADRYDGVLGEGDLVLADAGAESTSGWASDVTRTWPAAGTYSATQRAVYDVVLAANVAVIGATRPGARWRDLHLLAARTIAEGLVEVGLLRGEPASLVEEGATALFFPHGVGHLIGMDVHDMEDLGDRAGYAAGRTRDAQFGLSYLRLDRDLRPGMCVTVEPGFYIVPALLADPRFARFVKERVDAKTLERFRDVRGIRIEDDVLVTDDGCEVLTRAIPKRADDVEHAVRG